MTPGALNTLNYCIMEHSIFTVEIDTRTVTHSGAGRCKFTDERKESTIFANYDAAKAFATSKHDAAKQLHRETYTRTTDKKGRDVLTYTATDIWIYRSDLDMSGDMFLYGEMLGHLDSSDAITSPRLVLSYVK